MGDLDGVAADAAPAGAASVPGQVSWWVGPVGGPARVEHAVDEVHFAASTVKLAVLVAALRERVSRSNPVLVHDDFGSAATGQRFSVIRGEDSDELVWACLGRHVAFLWLV